MKKFIKENYIYLLSFLIGIILISILYIMNDVSPFGKKSLLTIDFFHQYGPMLGEYYDRFKNGSNLIYSFNSGLGLPIFRNFLNYLASPFNFIILLFKREHLLTSFSVIIALKCAASCTTMTYYLSKKFKTKNLCILPISILYAFQAYFISYYWNIMWIDGIVFLPLIVLGIENIINNNKWKLYTITLGIMLIANYFIAYMICIYSCLYFLIYLIYKSSIKFKSLKKDLLTIIKKSLTFAKASLLAGGISAFMLIPLGTSISSISATHDLMPSSNYYSFTVEDFINGHLSAISTTTFASDEITNPNVSCGIISVILLVIFIINYKIPLKKKLCYLALLLVIASCFFIPQLDFIMHAFHVPNDLPYRYSFLYSFTLLVICAYSLYHLKDLKYEYVLLGYFTILLVLRILLFTKWPDITNSIIIVNMIIITILLVFYSYIYFFKNMYMWFTLLFILVSSIDVVVSTNRNWNIGHILNNFYTDYNEIENNLNVVRKKENDIFYRIEKTNILTFNDPSWYNYHGMETFSSMAYEKMAILQNKLGMPGNKINSYYYVHQTPIYDMMFNIKYFIGEKNDYNRYTTLENNLNEFKYNLPLGYAVNPNIKDWDYESYNPFIVQNDFISLATGIYNVLSPLDYQKQKINENDNVKVIKYTIQNPNDNFYYYSNTSLIDFFIIGDCLYYRNDNYLNYISDLGLDYYLIDNYQEERIINIQSQDDTIDIIIGYNYYTGDDFRLYTINETVLEEVYNTLNKYPLEITSFKESNIKGSINIPTDMTVYTSIPYDAGWKVYIDGKKVKTNDLGDALLTFDVKSGKHTINIKYEIPNIKIGLIITFISMVYIIFDTLKVKKNSKKV